MYRQFQTRSYKCRWFYRKRACITVGVTQKFLLEIKHLHAEPNSEGGKPLGNSNISKSDLLADPCAGDGSGSSGERHSIAEKALTKSVSFLDPCAMLFSEKECHLENFTDSVADISDKLSGEHGHECREEQDEKGLRQQQDSQEQQIQEQLQQLDSQEQQMQEQLQQLANKDARILSLEQQLRVLTQQHLTELQQERKQHEAHTEKLRNDILENEELVCEFQATLDRLHDQLHQREHNLWKTQQELRCQKKELERRDEQLMEKIEQLREKEETITNLLQQQSQRSMSSPIHPTSTPPPGFTFAYKITSRGLENATTNVAVELTIEVVDAYCRPYASDREITAEIKSQVDGSIMSAKVVKVTPCQYKVIYKPQTRGFCDLHIMADNADIHGSPFKVFVHHPPSLLSCPVRVIENIALPWGISLNSHGDILVTENGADRVLVIDGHGKTVRTIGCGLLKCPTGIAVDDSDHVYVASEHCLLKFSQLGEVVNTVGMRGNKYGEFDCPMGISIHQEQLYVCDWLNERVQVFDLNLRFLKCFSITGAGSKITDLAFDSMGKIYTIDHRNNRVYVLDPDTFQYEPDFGQYGEELKDPTGIHIADYVYVSDCSNHRVVVYSLSGEFIACFGGEGTAPGLLSQPRCITTDPNGFVYVCDFGNGRIQVF